MLKELLTLTLLLYFLSFSEDPLVATGDNDQQLVDIEALLDQKKIEKLSMDEVLKHQHRITLPVRDC